MGTPPGPGALWRRNPQYTLTVEARCSVLVAVSQPARLTLHRSRPRTGATCPLGGAEFQGFLKLFDFWPLRYSDNIRAEISKILLILFLLLF